MKDISNDLTFLEPNETSNRSDAELNKPFCEMVKIYSDAKELSRTNRIDHNGLQINTHNNKRIFLLFRLISDFNAIHEFIIFVYFMWILLNVCIQLLILKAQIVVSSIFLKLY